MRDLSGSGQYLTHAGGLGIADPNDPIWTFIWAEFDSTFPSQVVLSIGRAGAGGERRYILISSNTIQAVSQPAAGQAAASAAYSTTGVKVGILAEWVSRDLRAITVANGTRATDTTDRLMSVAPNEVRVGATHTGSAPFNGRIGPIGIWRGTATADDATALWAGIHPELIRPADQLEVLDLDGRTSPERSRRGNAYTITGSPGYADAPRLFRRRSRSLIWVPSSAGGGVTGDGAATGAAGQASGTGTSTVTGDGAASGAAGQAAGAGTSTIAGSGAATGAAGQAAGTGNSEVGGSGAAAAQPGQAAGAGSPEVAGSGTAAGAAGAAAGAGTPTVTGSGAATGAAGQASGSDGSDVTGEGAATAAAGQASGTGTSTVVGEGAAESAPGIAGGGGSSEVTGSGAAQTQSGAASGSGTSTLTGDGAASTPTTHAAGAGSPIVTGSGAAVGAAGQASGSEAVLPTYAAIRITAVRAGAASITARAGRASISARTHLSEDV